MQQGKTTIAYIALGSNLGNREKNITLSLKLIKQKCGKIIKYSQIIETPPMLHPIFPQPCQNNFLNSMIMLETKLTPMQLIDNLIAIEELLGRTKKNIEVGWPPRIIDLDIIAIDDIVIKSKKLIIPHPQMHKRYFVLKPFSELNPFWIHPIIKKSSLELLKKLLIYKEKKIV